MKKYIGEKPGDYTAKSEGIGAIMLKSKVTSAV
jgi:hypothetical protein